MKTLNYLLSLFVTIAFLSSCATNEKNEANNETSENTPEEKIIENKPIVKVETAKLVYFHYTKRCATCNAIGNVSREVLADYVNKASFSEYNLDEKDGEEMGKNLKVDGQTLLVVYGDKQIDLTEDAFLNAKSNPEKFKEILKEKLEAVLL